MEINLLKKIAVKVLNMTDAEFATTFVTKVDEKDTLVNDWENVFITKDADRIAKLKETHTAELTAMHDKGHKKGKSETLETFEAELKTKYGYEGAEKGLELIAAIVKTNAPDKTKDIKTTPEYLELEKKYNKLEKEVDTKVKAKEDEVRAEFTKKSVTDKAKDKAREILMEELKPILGTNQAVNETRINSFLFDIEQNEYQDNNGTFLILGKDGKRVETANGHPYDFIEYVKEKAGKHFEFEVQKDKGNGGNDNNDKDKDKDKTTVVPKSWGEVMSAVAQETDPVKVKEIYAAYETQQAATK